MAREPAALPVFGAAGETLPSGHGFPLCLVASRLLGYKSAKYVHRVDRSDQPLRGFWVQNAYLCGGEVPSDRLHRGRY